MIPGVVAARVAGRAAERFPPVGLWVSCGMAVLSQMQSNEVQFLDGFYFCGKRRFDGRRWRIFCDCGLGPIGNQRAVCTVNRQRKLRLRYVFTERQGFDHGGTGTDSALPFLQQLAISLQADRCLSYCVREVNAKANLSACFVQADGAPRGWPFWRGQSAESDTNTG